MNRDHLHSWHETFAPLGAPIRNEPKPALGRNWLLTEFETKNHALFSPGDVLRYSDNKRLAGTFLRYEEGGKAARYVQGGFDHIDYLEVIANDGLTVPRGMVFWLRLLMADGRSVEDAAADIAAFSVSFDAPAVVPLSAAVPLLPGPAAGDDGWIEWRGGESPVPNSARVIVVFGGTAHETSFPELLRWTWNEGGDCGDITRYRVVRP